jgi:hypothetical protein
MELDYFLDWWLIESPVIHVRSFDMATTRKKRRKAVQVKTTKKSRTTKSTRSVTRAKGRFTVRRRVKASRSVARRSVAQRVKARRSKARKAA